MIPYKKRKLMSIIAQLSKTILGATILGILTLKISSCALNELPDIDDNKSVFGMYLNGSRWIPNAFSNSSKRAYYYAPYKILKIQAIKTLNSGDAKFAFYISNVKGVGVYQASFFMEFKATPNCLDSTRYDANSGFKDYFKLVNPGDSYIEIVEFDSIESRVSGYFDMVLHNDSGTKIDITEGRFSLNLN
jgi:hypothetical protein